MTTKMLSCLAVVLTLGACGDADTETPGTPGTGGMGGGFVVPPPTGQRTYRATCEYSTLLLELEIDFDIELTEAFSDTSSTQIAFNAAVTFTEEAAVALIDDGVTAIDIASVSVRVGVEGGNPTSILTTLAGVPIDEFDVTLDPDENGTPGPHRLDLQEVISSGIADNGESFVIFTLSEVVLGLGDFRIPNDCLGFSVSGVPLRFPVNPS